MALEQELPTILHRVDGQSHGLVLDVLGPTIEVLSRPFPGDGGFCVLRGVLPPGVTIPLHSHEDPEDFYLLAGSSFTAAAPTTGPPPAAPRETAEFS